MHNIVRYDAIAGETMYLRVNYGIVEHRCPLSDVIAEVQGHQSVLSCELWIFTNLQAD